MTEPSLPRRTRAHVLDSASERRFKVAIPEEWLATAPERDYGIDLQIEVFEQRGETHDAFPTGVQFGAQLKATDGELAEALRVGVRWETVNYWTSLPVPVLLVRYVAADTELYVTWVHDRFRSLVINETAATWFRFDPERDLLTPERALQLADEARNFTAIREHRFDWPLHVAVDDRIGDPLTIVRVVREASELQAGLARTVDFRIGGANPMPPTLVFDDDRLAFNLGAGFATIVMTDGATREIARGPRAPADILALVASTLSSAGEHDAAVAMFARAVTSATAFGGSRAFLLALSALRVGDRQLALTLLSAAASTTPLDAVKLAHILVPPPAFAMPPEEKDWIERALRAVPSLDLAPEQAAYNRDVGRWLARVGDLPAAKEAYAEAKRHDPALETDSTFWFEFGSVLFENRDRDEAEAAYEQSLALGNDTSACRGLYADTILADGRYGEAHAEFATAASTDQWPFAVLGGIASEAAIMLVGERQERDPEAAQAIIDSILVGERDVTLEAAEEVLRLDALHPFAWHFAAMVTERSSATALHATSAWLARFNAEFWSRAAMSALAQIPDSVLATSIVQQAEQYVGDLFEGSANTLANLMVDATRESLTPEEHERVTAEMAAQLADLRNRIDEIRRKRGSGDLVRRGFGDRV